MTDNNNMEKMKKDKALNLIEEAVKEIFEIDLTDKDVFKKRLAGSISRSESIEQQILSLYYCDKLTAGEIGEIYSVDEKDISQIMGAVAVKLKIELIKDCSRDIQKLC